MGDKIISRGKFKGYKIVAAETNLVNQQGKNIDKLLLMIGEYMGWEGDTSHVFVSDESRIGDFSLENYELEELSTKLGFKVNQKDFIYEIALKMKPAN